MWLLDEFIIFLLAIRLYLVLIVNRNYYGLLVYLKLLALWHYIFWCSSKSEEMDFFDGRCIYIHTMSCLF